MLEIKISVPDIASAINSLAAAISATARGGEGDIAAKDEVCESSVSSCTLEMLALAGSRLIDEGKMELLLKLLADYGIEAITELDSSQYADFAKELRALGAKL